MGNGVMRGLLSKVKGENRSWSVSCSALPAWQGSESRRESVHGGLAAVPTARDGGSVDYAGAIIDLFQTLSPPRQAVHSTGNGVMCSLLSKVKGENRWSVFVFCAPSLAGFRKPP